MLFTLAEATALETPDLYASLQTNLPELGKIEDTFMAKAQELLNLIKNKDTKAIVERMEQLKKKLKEADSDFARILRSHVQNAGINRKIVLAFL